MDKKNLIVSGLAVYVVHRLLDFLVHAVLLSGAYEATADVWRPEDEMMSMSWIMFLTSLLWSFIFVHIFGRVRQGEGIVEGLRYGFCIGLFVAVPMAYNSYVVMPVPHSLALLWFVYGMLQIMICGAVLSLVYRPQHSTA